MMNEVIISVGSNIKPQLNVRLAQKYISEITDFIKASGFYVTKPMDYLEQPDFFNGAFLINTKFDYEELNAWLKKIELKQGRIKTENKAGPRCIDLDIIVWNGEIIDDTFYKWNFIKKVVLELKPELEYKEHE